MSSISMRFARIFGLRPLVDVVLAHALERCYLTNHVFSFLFFSFYFILFFFPFFFSH